MAQALGERLVNSLADIVVLNDASDFKCSGDVGIYPSRDDACFALEPNDVKGGNIYALSGTGQLLALDVDGDRVEMRDIRDGSDHTTTLRSWLTDLAISVAATRKRSARWGDHITIEPGPEASIEELVRYIGFAKMPTRP